MDLNTVLSDKKLFGQLLLFVENTTFDWLVKDYSLKVCFLMKIRVKNKHRSYSSKYENLTDFIFQYSRSVVILGTWKNSSMYHTFVDLVGKL